MSLREKVESILMDNIYTCEAGRTPSSIADKILALIDRQRCVWTGNDYGGYKTSCGKFIYRSKPNYCENCGCKVEVKGE